MPSLDCLHLFDNIMGSELEHICNIKHHDKMKSAFAAFIFANECLRTAKPLGQRSLRNATILAHFCEKLAYLSISGHMN